MKKSDEMMGDNSGDAEAKQNSMKGGKSEAGTKSMEGVDVPEDFQKEVHGMMKKVTTKHHMNHVRSKLNDKESEMQKAEKEGPASYDTGGMPE